MRARRIVDTDTVIQLYTGGDAPSTIARRLSCGRSTVTQALREAGVAIRPRVWHGCRAADMRAELAWMDEDRPPAEERASGCCDAFRRGVVAASVGNPDLCVRCAAQQKVRRA